MSAARPRGSLVVAVGVTAFVAAASVMATQEARRSGQPRREQLIGLIRERQAEVEQLERDVAELREDALDAGRRVSSRSAALASRQESVRALVGLVPVEGPGLEVALRDSDLVASGPAEQRALRVLDLDLQLVTNALWGAGAEAIAVNDQRLVSTSSIRAAGETITVNFRPLRPPYVIVAVGADREAFDRSAVAERFERWVDLFGFGFEVGEHERVEVPAYAGPTRLPTARPASGEQGGE